ncbi:phosphatase [Flammeovirgaceae bacterium SG7u.111]|nr:phosphatase [Flammeovirgaceae bacterium SG7u.132]WPO36498.1 phosphatase [Flammeovirgaceae bacterium SG7u.111]
MRIAAIDIGSNAIRFRVVEVFEDPEGPVFKKIENVRFPLRLGAEVFSEGKISLANEDRFIKLMQAYRVLMDLYSVEHHIAHATSAMREAENGLRIANRVADYCHLNLSIIDGEREADLLANAINPVLGEGNYAHIDVGGGSTEINLYKDKVHLGSRSFKLGSVRGMLSNDRGKTRFNDLGEWVEGVLGETDATPIAIGTGGNIKAMYEQSKASRNKIGLKKLISTRNKINALDIEERIRKLKMGRDRADVIVQGADIYINVMKKAKAKSIIVPGTGLIDGIIQEAYNEYVGFPSQIRNPDKV